MAKKKEPDKLDKLVGELTQDATAEELLKDSGLLKELKKRLVEAALDAEMTDHLGYEKHSPDGHGTGNSRNGKTSKLSPLKSPFEALDQTHQHSHRHILPLSA
jgi:hypothetical protein